MPDCICESVTVAIQRRHGVFFRGQKSDIYWREIQDMALQRLLLAFLAATSEDQIDMGSEDHPGDVGKIAIREYQVLGQ